MRDMDFIFSKHALEQARARGISTDIINTILANPDLIQKLDKLTVFQGFERISEKVYLIRVFVNMEKLPPMIVTVYRTSKINKYHES
jgi:hypothetical protein